MITYELAKQLKEAGYIPKSKYYEERQNSYVDIDEEYSAFITTETCIYVPSLSELIEACGEYFEELSGRYNNEKLYGYKWLATAIEQEPWNNKSNVSGTGSTPEEAVARLWLELNK